jgi:hypothetical protein
MLLIKTIVSFLKILTNIITTAHPNELVDILVIMLIMSVGLNLYN